MPSSNRCVFGCVTTGVTIHKFPNPVKYPEIFRKWVVLAGESLRGMADDVIYRNRNVCDRHFAENVKNRNNRLNNLAVPTLQLPHIIVDDPKTSSVCEQQLQSNLQKRQSSPSNQSKLSRTTGTKNASAWSTCYTSLQQELKQLKSEVCRLRKTNKNFKTRLASAIKLSNNKALQKITEKMNVPSKLFTTIQFREAGKKHKGHRFTNEEKILALSLYKRSPKCYSLLSKCFTLPSAKCLKNFVGKIKISPGINGIIFEKIAHTVGEMSEDDRLCTLIFDEMSIRPQIHFNAAQDQFKGFTTIGSHNLADHVLTFMIRGIKQNYKQPVAYYFTSCLNKIDLKKAIVEVVKHVQSTGLKILATVCDHSTVNVGAIESLVEDAKAIYIKRGLQWRNDLILIGKSKIIPLFDTPHLLKGIRNNLLTKDLIYLDHNGVQTLVKWDYFIKMYEVDELYGELKLLPKLTEDHIDPKKINKMKVKTATQIFSRSVAVAAQHLVDSGKLNGECADIVPFVLIMDKLFDSLNCNTFQSLNGKDYRAGVKVNSPHHKLWQECIKFLKNMKFIDRKKEGSKIRLIEKVVCTIN